MNWPSIKLILAANNSLEINALIQKASFLQSPQSNLLKAANFLRKMQNTKQCLQIIKHLESQSKGESLCEVLFLKGDLFLDQKEFKKAANCYSTILKNKVSDVALNNRAYAYANLGFLKQALLDYESAINVNPENVVARRGAAEVSLKLKRPYKAIEHYKLGIKIAPLDASMFTGLAMAFLELKEWPKAYKCFIKAKKIEPDNTLADQGIQKIEHWFDLK